MFHVKQIINKFKEFPITEILFYLFVFSIPLQFRIILNSDEAYIGYYFSYHKTIFIYLSDLLFAAYLITSLIFDRPFKISKVALIPLVIPIFSLFHVEHFGLWFYGSLKLAEFCILIAIMVKNKHLVTNTLKIFILSAFVQCGLAVSQFHFEWVKNLNVFYVPEINESGAATINLNNEKILRAYGTFPHPNVLGGFLAIAFGTFLYVSRETKINIINTLKLLSGTIVLLWGLLVGFSRSAWIAAVLLALIFITYLILRKAYKQAIYWSLIIGISVLILMPFYAEIVFHRSADIVENSSNARGYRETFNNRGFEVFKDNSLLGVGINLYVPYTQKLFHVEPWAYQPPHNIFLLLIAEVGVIGILIYVFTLSRLGFMWNLGAVLGGTAIVVLGFFDHYLLTIQQGQLTLALLMGMFLGKQKDVSRETS
jgi:O-antigen ligase